MKLREEYINGDKFYLCNTYDLFGVVLPYKFCSLSSSEGLYVRLAIVQCIRKPIGNNHRYTDYI